MLALEEIGIVVVEDGRYIVPPAYRQAVVEALVVVTDYALSDREGGEHEVD